MVKLRHSSYEFALEHNVKPQELLPFAVAAHNAGNGGALRGYQEGDVDKYTTGGDYSADVLVRAAQAEAWLMEKKFI